MISPVKASDNTEWTSPLHLANKPGGGVRPCPDFRSLNSKTSLDSFPLPLLSDFTSKIHGSTIFTKLDLRASFYNIPIWPQHRFKTTTLSPWGGAYVYNRLAFGLKSGPSTMQKLMEHTLQGIQNFITSTESVVFVLLNLPQRFTLIGTCRHIQE